MLGLKKKSCFEELHVFGQNYVADVHIPSLIDRVKKSLGKINGMSVVYYTSLIHVIIYHSTVLTNIYLSTFSFEEMVFFKSMTSEISLDQLKQKANDFDSKTSIGEGSYGEVYNVVLDNGQHLAVKN